MALGSEVYKGAVFFRYTVIEDRQIGSRYVKCQCECGVIKNVRYGHLGTIAAISCGCYAKDRSTFHGMVGTPEYYAWAAMIQRCTNLNSKDWRDYGGRGILVCDNWLSSFINFYIDMGPKPSGCSLDRIDNDGNYEPNNCRWATKEVQSNNQRVRKNAVWVSAFGERKILMAWSKDSRCVVSYSILHKRIAKGWPPELAISTLSR